MEKEMTKRRKAIKWWNFLGMKEKESWVKMLMPVYRDFESLTGREIELIYDVHYGELEAAALEYYNENIVGEPITEETFFEGFIAGCEYILNGKSFN